MGRGDWYRRTTWDESDQIAFFERLNRSRGKYHKSQYARIQASYLQKAGLVKESLQLLYRLYDEWPDESQLSTAYWQEAQCYLELGDLDSAVKAYRQCFEAERNHGLGTNARVEFLWLVATRGLSDLYQEALVEMEYQDLPLLFPVDQYRVAGAYALIFDELGQVTKVAEYATAALDAASKTDSGLRYHKGLGLVANPDRKIIRKLKRLTSN